MKVRLVIDRVKFDGPPLSGRARVLLADSLHRTLERLVRQQLAVNPLPDARNVARETTGMALPAGADGEGIGQAMGAAIAAQAWGGQGQGGTR